MLVATIRDRFKRKVTEIIEPIAQELWAWCRTADQRFTSIEQEIHSFGQSLDSDRERAFWSHEALVERLNHSAAREVTLIERITALEEAMKQETVKHEFASTLLGTMQDRLNTQTESIASIEDQLLKSYWSREALVERLNFVEARDEMRTTSVDSQIETIDRKVTESRLWLESKASLPTAPDLEALAMSRRLAAIEDEIERLLTRNPESNPAAQNAELLAFARSLDDDRDKAVG